MSHDSASWEVARDLYLQCLQADPNYAPAWARLGRVYHVIGKYRGTSDDYVRSESALNRALELNPDLSIADHFYAQLEVADGRAQDAMVRLVRRASSHSSDPELFAAVESVLRRAVEGRELDASLISALLEDEEDSRLQTHLRFSSHRPVTGPLIIFIKRRILLPVMRWLYEYSLENFRRQQQVNRILFACLEELAIENARLQQLVKEQSGRR